MPSRKKSKTTRKISKKKKRLVKTKSFSHPGFFPLLFIVFVVWILYRSLFNFPVWFDESIGKAIFLGLPVWLYISMSGFTKITDSFAPFKMKRGLLLGIAIGGIYGFVAAMLGSMNHSGPWASIAIYTSDKFWWEFALALLTGFWETLFFYSFVMMVVRDKMHNLSFFSQVILTAIIFILFHLPNTILRFSGAAIAYQAILLFLFAIGQAYLFSEEENAYSLILSHAIWGMVLLIHF